MTTKVAPPRAPVQEKSIHPNIPRLLEAIRCIGHSLEDSVGDLADNALAADASKVGVIFSGQRSFDRLEIADNGHGMNAEQLEEALRLGSQIDYPANSLSKYGMGLKSAALTQGGRLTVLTHADAGPLLKAVLDIELVKKREDYVVQFPTPSAQDTELFEHRTGGIGTILVVDSIHPERAVGITACVNRIKKMIAETYHRFMTATDPVTFEVNGEIVEPFDPLFIGDPSVEDLLKPQTLEFTDANGAPVLITVRATQLPHPPSQTNRRETKDRYHINQRNIGFYFYRANRVVRRADPIGLFTPDTKLLSFRASIDFDPDADSFFSLDVAKRRVVLSESVRGQLERVFTPVINHSRNLWKGEAKKKPAADEGTSIHKPASSQINAKGPLLSTGRKDRTSAKQKGSKASPRINRLPAPPKDRVRIIEVETLNDGLLWEPSLDNDGQVYVRINKSHPFYDVVYRAYSGEDPSFIEAVDYLFWGLAHAEYNVGYDEDDKIEIMESIRRFASDNLRRLLSE